MKMLSDGGKKLENMSTSYNTGTPLHFPFRKQRFISSLLREGGERYSSFYFKWWLFLSFKAVCGHLPFTLYNTPKDQMGGIILPL